MTSVLWHGTGYPDATIEAEQISPLMKGQPKYLVIRIGEITIFPTQEQAEKLSMGLNVALYQEVA